MPRPHRIPLSFVCLGAIGVLLASCITEDGSKDHPLRRTEFWRDYAKSADWRAMAVAGDPERIWVGGTAAGQESVAVAEALALESCEAQRRRRRMRDPCVIYARGSELDESNIRRSNPWQ